MSTLNMNRTTVAVLGDLHYGTEGAVYERRSDIADILLQRAVHRLNRLVRPDVTLLLGDVLDAGNAPDAARHRANLRTILGGLESPCLVIPGNHDGDAAAFYRDFPQPPAIVDIAGLRFLSFLDQEEPNYNASRAAHDTARFRQARSGWRGPIVALQHVPLLPPVPTPCPYNYLNAPDILAAMREAGVTLSLSAHYHAGLGLIEADGTAFVTAPALCEKPFAFAVVTIDGTRVVSEWHPLAMRPTWCLVDRHVHSPFAYCSENMDFTKVVGLVDDFGLSGVDFTEHSGQLYFPASRYWAGDCQNLGLAGARAEGNRIDDYLRAARRHASPAVRVGFELDCDLEGTPVVADRDRDRADCVIGAIHALPGLTKGDPGSAVHAADGFLRLLERFLTHDVRILAHPFRVFRQTGAPVPVRLFEPTVRLLKRFNTAAEVNFHADEPSIEFVRLCLEAGVKLSFGSDAHNLCEVGDFALHLDLLRRAGFDGNPGDVLVTGDGESMPTIPTGHT